MAERYSYENIEFTEADPSLIQPKPKASTNPRVPLPVSLTDALREQADGGNAQAVVVPGTEKAAKNLVTRMRSWVGKELKDNLSVKAAVTPNGNVQGGGEPDSWVVTFQVVPKRTVVRKPKGEQLELPLDDESTDESAEEAPAKPRRSRKSS